MLSPKIVTDLKTKPGHPLPENGVVCPVTTRDGYALRSALWAAPGFKLEIGKPDPAPQTEETAPAQSETPPPGEQQTPPEPAAEQEGAGSDKEPTEPEKQAQAGNPETPSPETGDGHEPTVDGETRSAPDDNSAVASAGDAPEQGNEPASETETETEGKSGEAPETQAVEAQSGHSQGTDEARSGKSEREVTVVGVPDAPVKKGAEPPQSAADPNAGSDSGETTAVAEQGAPTENEGGASASFR